MAHATVANFILRYDERTLIRLATDDVASPPASADTPVVTTALDDASAIIDAAVYVAGIYDADDLDNLTDSADSLLKRLTCKIAMTLMIARRPEKFGTDGLKAIQEETEMYLDRLRNGERIFGITDDTTREEAGVLELDAPSAIELELRHGIRTRASRAFPNRQIPI